MSSYGVDYVTAVKQRQYKTKYRHTELIMLQRIIQNVVTELIMLQQYTKCQSYGVDCVIQRYNTKCRRS